MEEDILEFHKLLGDIDEPVYLAQYDPESLKVKKVGPENAFTDRENVIQIDIDLGKQICSGEIRIGSCYIDLHQQEIKVSEYKNLFKIDDVLHRIPLKEWFDSDRIDLAIFLFDNEIKIELGEQWNGTYMSGVLPSKRNITWGGDKKLDFLITDYNDPNIIHDAFSVNVEELYKKSFSRPLKVGKTQFSVYTKRIFKNYVCINNENS
jgi:hypothetical protein